MSLWPKHHLDFFHSLFPPLCFGAIFNIASNADKNCPHKNKKQPHPMDAAVQARLYRFLNDQQLAVNDQFVCKDDTLQNILVGLGSIP